MSLRIPFLMLAVSAPLAAARAQTSFPEIEPNETKATATAAACLVAGDSVTGTSTGSVTTAGPTSVDTFRVQTCALPLGIYEHRLTLATANGGSIRGVTQTGTIGVGGTPTTTEIELQSNQTTPSRFNVWYGFGKGEEIYYRVTGAAATTTPYAATLSTTPITATPVAGAFNPGSITITTVGQGHTTDTEVWVYDSTLTAIPGFGNDDVITPFSRQSNLVRTYAAGVYYVAITQYSFSNNLGAANDDDWVSGPCTDFANVAVQGINTHLASMPINFSISDGATTTPVAAVLNATSNEHEVRWFTFTVGTPVVFNAFCTNGSLGTDHTTPCPCGNIGLPGNGCGHSFDPNGANMSATGSAANDDVVLHSQFEPVSSFTLMMQHASAGDSIFHDGVICAGNPLIRLRGRSAVAGEAFFPNSNFAQDSTTTLSIRGGVPVGSGFTRYYAGWYRNASSTFCPPATANVTNGWVIVW